MAKAFITEFGARRKDSNGRTLPYPNHPPLASQAVSISDTSAQSAAFAEHTRFIRISADVECAYKVGENPTATTSDAVLAADEIEYIGVRGGDKVALVALTPPPPEITIVDSSTNTASSATGITLTLPAGLQQDDVVYVVVDVNAISDITFSEDSSTWTKLADLYSDDTVDSNLGIFRKVMGATPDTSINVGTSAAASWSALVVAFRNVNTTAPEDTAVVTNTGANSGNPNPPSATSATDGAWALAIGGSTQSGTPLVPANPSGYTNLVFANNGTANVMIATRALGAAPVSEDPSAFQVPGQSTSDAWCSALIILKPASA
jgi:hypothetical protein